MDCSFGAQLTGGSEICIDGVTHEVSHVNEADCAAEYGRNVLNLFSLVSGCPEVRVLLNQSISEEAQMKPLKALRSRTDPVFQVTSTRK